MSETDVERLKRTALFKMLLDKEKKEATEISLEDHEISVNIITLVRKAAPLLERVPENMPEFTLHNVNHSIHVIENIERIIPKETLENLNTIEISILIYAAYLHDIGMISSSDERNQIIETEEFKKLLTSDEELYKIYKEARDKGEYRTASDIEKKVFANFLRQNHVQHAHKIIKEYELDSEISWKNISYCKWVRAVCDSHELPVKDLYNTKSWPNETYVLNQPVNVQYLAVVFRLADKLDIDPERTPKTLFYYISPKDDISISEWEKHLSITGFPITHEKIKIVADCKHPQIERTLRKFIREIDEELEDSLHLVLGYRDNIENKYKLKISEQVEAEIHSHGYEYCDFRFELDYRRVLDLLMGEGLYGDPIVALRELLQNSVDAVRYREFLEKKEGNGYEPHIEISLKNDELTVEDNGIGMDEKIFENYFMKVGRSYYQSLDFRKKNIDIDPGSEFGIGILSVFMIADNFTVESKKRTFEDEPPSKPIYFEIPTAYDYFVKRSSKRTKSGTKITLHLKPNHPFFAETLTKEISELAPFIEYPIVVYTANGEEKYKPLLPGDMPEDNNYTNEYFEVRLGEMNKFEGIEGVLRVTQKSKNIELVAQKGFSIPYYVAFGACLFRHVDASINISGQAKLTLSPSRSSVIVNEKFHKITDKLQSEILSGLEEHLKYCKASKKSTEYVKHINELLNEKVLSLETGYIPQELRYRKLAINEYMKRIFLNNVPLLNISENGGRSYNIMADLDKLPTIAITASSSWPEKRLETKILEETKKLIHPEPILLLDEEKGHFTRLEFFNYILGRPSQICITSIPGVVINIFSTNETESKTFDFHRSTFISKIHNIIKNNKPLFVHNLKDDGPYDVIFNSEHWLLSRFFNSQQPKDELSLKAIKILIDNINNALDVVWTIVFSEYYERKNEMGRSYNLNHKLIGVIKYYPEIFEEFNEAVKKFWKEAQSLEAIPLEEEFPGITSDDLPWFWSHKLE